MSSEDEGLNETGPAQSIGVTDASQTIVDTVLDLDEALSGDVRRAERTARFCTKPWLQADLDALEAELADLVDDRGMPLEKIADAPMSSPTRDYTVVMSEYKAKQEEFVAAMRSVRVSAMEPSKWEAFKSKYKKPIDDEVMSPAMRKELVTSCSIAPAIDEDAYTKLLDRYGEIAMAAIGRAAWAACDHSGVDVPKSLVFSAVQRQLQLSRS